MSGAATRRAMVAALAATAALWPAGTQARPAAPASCAAGRPASAAVAQRLRDVLATRRARFEHTLDGVTPASRRAAGAQYATAVEAYVYGFPIIMVRRTIARFPRNLMVSISRLAGASTRSIVAPNHDTLYSIGQLDLTAGPIVIQTAPTGGRYSVLQLTDGFTNAAAYLGDGAAAATGETAVVVPPGYAGDLPAEVRVIRPATRLLWLLGRTLATADPADQAAATALLRGYSVTPLADWLAGARNAPLTLADFPAAQDPVVAPTGLAFFDELGADLGADPPPAPDACAIRAFATVGIGAGRTPSTLPTGTTATALRAAAADGRAVIDALVGAVAPGRHGAWTRTPTDIARFGTDYVGRAVVARVGLGANTVDKALYPNTRTDDRGRALNGAHVYRVHFAPGQLPPVRPFWSLTLYDRNVLFYDNPLDRYAIGDRTQGLRRDADGGLTILVSHADPGAARRSNWLPAPSGPFSLYLRLYEPAAAARSGAWRPPDVVRVR
ncbi:DUF1254 domain-containing protein [Baekduia soli]|uniref:DUF1254 domain-containing protein n=1 Tax=Baekduia soli TaxID=496014 RepID=A0A5B8U0L5_9ACTN|nr:DUF1214 domain-containing protein [Baekduia soli]QEC46521.1 DUF1254 domain-containing protein [Baekduia soli]